MPEPSTKTNARDDVKRYRSDLREEVGSAALYRLLADAESNPHLKAVYQRRDRQRAVARWPITRQALPYHASVPRA